MDGPGLREERERRGLTQLQVAQEMGVTGARISHIENTVRVTDRTVERYMVAVRRALIRKEGTA